MTPGTPSSPPLPSDSKALRAGPTAAPAEGIHTLATPQRPDTDTETETETLVDAAPPSPASIHDLWPTGSVIEGVDGDSWTESIQAADDVMQRIARHLGAEACLVPIDTPIMIAEADGPPVQVPIVIDGRAIAALVCPIAQGEPEAAVELRARLLLAAELLAEVIGRDNALRHRIAELNAVYRVSSALAGVAGLDEMLQSSLRTIIEVMEVKAGSIRLLKVDNTDELVLRAWVNLSRAYFEKGPVFAGESEIDTQSLAGAMVYVEDLARDGRVRFPDLVQAEGLQSFLSTGLIFQDRPVGVIRLYTGEVRHFSNAERRLFQAASQQVATAIVNRRLLEMQERARGVQRQVAMASDIQRRMLPQDVPNIPPFDIATGYLPSLELGGDFYDFISVGHELGLMIGDVVGKGVPAALLMASVRANLRVYAGSFFQVDEIIGRTNRNLVHDTHTHEFATVWYGAIDSRNLQITFCNAGHEPALIFRKDAENPEGYRIHPLAEGGMVIGVDPRTRYRRAMHRLQPDDVLVAFTDGLPDAMNFDSARFGKPRIHRAVLDVLQQQPDATAKQIRDHVLWEMRRFVGLNTQSDDVTLVILRVAGHAPHQTASGRSAGSEKSPAVPPRPAQLLQPADHTGRTGRAGALPASGRHSSDAKAEPTRP